MAEDTTEEKTEEPTGRRLEKAREEGQVPRSKELMTTAILLAGSGGLLIFGSSIGLALEEIMTASFAIERDKLFDTEHMGLMLGGAIFEAFWGIAPVMLMLLVASVVGPIALGGFLFSTKALLPKLSRLSPIEGIKRMFSLKSLVELAKSVAKVLVVLGFAILILYLDTDDLLMIALEPTVPAMAHAVWTLGWSFFFLCCTMILISVIDVPFQIYDHTKNLRMTKQQVKDEMKDTEGKPEVKRKIRQLQFEMAQRRMMGDVPKADVVITNPEHFSVALKYDADSMGAPIVLAKGADQIALKIREVAAANNVEIIAAPPLARSVYYHTEIGGEIPSGLYVAVAQVLAYVFQLRRFRAGYAKRPDMPDFPIPGDLRRDS